MFGILFVELWLLCNISCALGCCMHITEFRIPKEHLLDAIHDENKGRNTRKKREKKTTTTRTPLHVNHDNNINYYAFDTLTATIM